MEQNKKHGDISKGFLALMFLVLLICTGLYYFLHPPIEDEEIITLIPTEQTEGLIGKKNPPNTKFMLFFGLGSIVLLFIFQIEKESGESTNELDGDEEGDDDE